MKINLRKLRGTQTEVVTGEELLKRLEDSEENKVEDRGDVYYGINHFHKCYYNEKFGKYVIYQNFYMNGGNLTTRGALTKIELTNKGQRLTSETLLDGISEEELERVKTSDWYRVEEGLPIDFTEVLNAWRNMRLPFYFIYEGKVFELSTCEFHIDTVDGKRVTKDEDTKITEDMIAKAQWYTPWYDK